MPRRAGESCARPQESHRLIMPELTCFRLLDAESPAGPLAEAVRQVNAGQGVQAVFTLDSASFAQVPNAPFAYWVEEKVRSFFRELPAFESEGRAARVGLQTGEDFRFVRCWWEVSGEPQTSPARRWWPFAKGGSYSPYYADLHLVVNWGGNGAELRSFDAAKVQNDRFYFRPGLTWPRRTNGLSFRALPADAIFADKGPAAFTAEPSLSLCAMVNSECFGHLISVQLARVELAQSFEVGIIQNTPLPNIDAQQEVDLARAGYHLWQAQQHLSSRVETSHVFISPWGLGPLTGVENAYQRFLAERSQMLSKTDRVQAQIEEIGERAFGFKPPASSRPVLLSEGLSSSLELAEQVVAYLMGLSFKRWRIIDAAQQLEDVLPLDPFAALPFSAPAAEVPPLAHSYQVESSGEAGDLLQAIQYQLARIGGQSASALESELVNLLNVDELRAYFRRSTGFFAYHLSVYSQSQRQAPIYWPLSTKSGNFTIWVYYPKLDDQSLPKLIADVLSPKIRTLSQEIENRRATPGGKVGELDALRQELEEMRTDFLDLINRGYRPNQNDGVIITACPLAKYFRHAGFRKNLDACWKELARGDYDWSHLAMAMWPDRVLEVCKKDRSIAIAHGKEDLCPAEPPKVTRGRKKTPSSP